MHLDQKFIYALVKWEENYESIYLAKIKYSNKEEVQRVNMDMSLTSSYVFLTHYITTYTFMGETYLVCGRMSSGALWTLKLSKNKGIETSFMSYPYITGIVTCVWVSQTTLQVVLGFSSGAIVMTEIDKSTGMPSEKLTKYIIQ